jgi:VanZ family protein
MAQDYISRAHGADHTECLLYFYNSTVKSEESNAESNAIAGSLQPKVDPNGTIQIKTFREIVRKAAHVLEFAALGVWFSLMALLLSRGVWRPVWEHISAPLFATLMTAVTDEFIQSFTGRTSSLKDVLIDFAGGLVGFFLTAGIYALVSSARRRRAL